VGSSDGRYVEWQGLQEVACWNDLREVATDAFGGLQFSAGLKKDDSLRVFVPERCRVAKLNATGTEHLFLFSL
jgi:hypothetical protein